MKQLLGCIFCVVLLVGFFACEKTIYINEISNLVKAKDLSNNNYKLAKEKTLVAIVLTNKTLKAKNRNNTVESLLKSKAIDVEFLKSKTGNLMFFASDETNGFVAAKNLKQPNLTAKDLNIDIKATVYSHLTTYKNTPVEVITYKPDAALHRIIDRGVGIIIVSTSGRFPDSWSF